MERYMRSYLRSVPKDKKILAKRLVSKAIKEGKLVRPYTCEDCGGLFINIYGHHEDYDKPLEVNWLCASCHVKRHCRGEMMIRGKLYQLHTNDEACEIMEKLMDSPEWYL